MTVADAKMLRLANTYSYFIRIATKFNEEMHHRIIASN
jgi:hypothetical protein